MDDIAIVGARASGAAAAWREREARARFRVTFPAQGDWDNPANSCTRIHDFGDDDWPVSYEDLSSFDPAMDIIPAARASHDRPTSGEPA